MSRDSVNRGLLGVARARLVESLSLLQADGSKQAGAAAIQATAELATVLGQFTVAVEYYGAAERILRGAQGQYSSRPGLDRIRAHMSQAQFEDAWRLSSHTPFPYEFYVSAALHWLEGLQLQPWHSREHAELKPTQDSGTTVELISQAREGRSSARERLATKYLEPLRRFAHGRLPNFARQGSDTDDLVQVTMMRGLERLEAVRAEGRGGLFAYLKKILINQTRDEMRRALRRREVPLLTAAIPSENPSPLDQVLIAEELDGYRRAISKLPARQCQAVVLRVENGYSYQEVADATGMPSANAARMAVSRGLADVAKTLKKS